MIFLLITIFLAIHVKSQTCIGQSGQPVAWWVTLKVPPKTGHSGYGYYDSTMKTATFLYYSNDIDKGNTPLTLTFTEINNLNL